MTDIIERVEGWLATPHIPVPRHVVRDLVSELKAAHAENELLKELNTYLAIWNTVYSGGSR